MPKEDPPPGVPEWIVTYGDMMSLLLTFFIMLVSLSEVRGSEKYQAMVEAIMKYMGYVGTVPAPSGEGFPLCGIVEKLATLGGHTLNSKGNGGVRKPGPSGSDVRVFTGREGTGVVVGGPIAFEPDKPDLSPTAREIVNRIAVQLAGKPNKIEVRGRARSEDGQTFSESIDLSYRRARQVFDLLVAAGIRRERLRISALGSNSQTSGDEIREEADDGVEVFVFDAFARDFVGPRSEP